MIEAKDKKFKTIFSLRIMTILKEYGFTPTVETDNLNKPGFKCWVYEVTPEFTSALDEILGGSEYAR